MGDLTVTVVEGPVAYTVADERFNNNISETDIKGLEFIKQLRPIVYNFDTKKFVSFLTKNLPDNIRNKYLSRDFNISTAIRQSGFIAQEVEQAAQKVGYNFNGIHVPDNESDNYSLAYSQFVIPLVKATQELSAKNDSLEKQLTDLKLQINAILQQLNNSKASTPDAVASSFTPDLHKKGDSYTISLTVYPNPASERVTLRYYIQNESMAKLELMDMNGRILLNITDSFHEVGWHEVSFDTSNLMNGTYICVLKTGSRKEIKQLIIYR